MNRQSFFIKSVVFLFVFSFAGFAGKKVFSDLFGYQAPWNPPISEVRLVVAQTISGSLIWSVLIAYLHNRNKLANNAAQK